MAQFASYELPPAEVHENYYRLKMT